MKKSPFEAEFDEGLWETLVENMTVHGKDDIEVLFRNGTIIRVD
ncbi:MAG: hypothetical protein ACFNUI_09615 [Negativicutes bacterium]